MVEARSRAALTAEEPEPLSNAVSSGDDAELANGVLVEVLGDELACVLERQCVPGRRRQQASRV